MQKVSICKEKTGFLRFLIPSPKTAHIINFLDLLPKIGIFKQIPIFFSSEIHQIHLVMNVLWFCWPLTC